MYKFENLISPDNHSEEWTYDYSLQEYLYYLSYRGLTSDCTFNGLTVTWVNEFDWSEKQYGSPVTMIYKFSITADDVYLVIGGTYSSLDGLEIDNGYAEVFPKQITTTIYTTIDGVPIV